MDWLNNEVLMKRNNIHITNIQNPFDPMHSREFKEMPNGLSLKQCIDLVKDPLDDCYYVASINGQLVPEGADYTLIHPQGNLVLCAVPQGGGGKNVLRIILQVVVVIAAAAATWYFGGAGGAAFAGYFGVSTQTVGLVAGLAVSAIGNALIGALLPYDMSDTAGSNTSSTYSWDASENANREGVVWPVLYGTMRIKPPIIGKYIDVENDKQYINILYAIADHEITSIDETSIKLNDNLVTQDVDGNIKWDYRLGAIDQSLIPFFSETHSIKSVAQEIGRHAKYSKETSYAPGAAVSYDNYPYICVTANGPDNEHTPTDTSTCVGPYSMIFGYYNVGDVVYTTDSPYRFYKCLKDNNIFDIHTPDETDYWEEYTEYWALYEHPYTTIDADGTQTEGLGIAVSFPYGLFYVKDDGSLGKHTINLRIQYKESADIEWTELAQYDLDSNTAASARWSGGYWKDSSTWVELTAGSTTAADHIENDRYTNTTPQPIISTKRIAMVWHWLAAEATYYTRGDITSERNQIIGSQSSAKRNVYYVDGLPPGSYQVRINFYGASPKQATKYTNTTYFDYVESIIYDDFAYPGSSIFAIRALATSKLSGSMPSLSLVATRSTVPIWTGAAYENLPADNPAWASIDVLHNTHYGGGVPYTKIEYDDFLAWANNCDLHYIAAGVASPVVFKCNYYIDASDSLRKILNNIGQCGRGNTVQMGSHFTCFVDKLENTPAQTFIFNMANINAKSFALEYLEMESRANAIDITFWDKDNGYKQRTIELHAVDFDTTTTEVKKTQLTLKGVVTLAEVLAHGYFALNCNRLLTCTASFDSDIDAIGCLPWDPIEVQHDVTLWGEGGLVMAATNASLVLDKNVTLSPGKTYTLKIQHAADDTIKEYILSAVTEETTSISVDITTAFNPTPQQYDKWVISEIGAATKLFRMIKTIRKNDLTRSLVCLEYNPLIYDDSKALTLETEPATLIQEQDLIVKEIQSWNGSGDTAINLSWSGFALGWYVFWKRTDDTSYTYAGATSTPFFRITQLDILTDEYTFCVSHTTNPEDGITVDLILTGTAILVHPEAPVDLTATLVDQNINLAWTKSTDLTVNGYNVYLDATLIASGLTGNTYTYIGTLTAETYTFTITATSLGGESDASSSASIAIAVPATPSPAATIVGEQGIVTWANCKTSLPISYYKVNTINIGNTLRYIDRIDFTGTRTYSIIAVDIAGNESEAGTTSLLSTALTTPTGITTTGLTYAIRLALTYETFSEFDKVEIWAASTNSRLVAEKVGETAATFWTHNGLDLVDKKYYWIRTRNIYGTVGDWYPASVTAGVEGNTSTSPDDYIAILDGYDNLNQIAGIDFLVAGQINGENAIGLTGDLIIDGSILARNIGTNEIIANSANIKDAIITNAKIISLDISKLNAGTITSKQIYLAIEDGQGDVWLAAGKRDFKNSWVLGDSTTQFDITNPSGTAFRYTWDGTGTDPLISAATMQIGTSVVIAAQNFSTNNNGTFVLTAVGDNYFEITNASGVAENDKTIGTGSISVSDAGFILGLDDSDSNIAKFYIGNASNYLNWDGSSLTIIGNLKTGISGARLEFLTSDNKLHFYDSGNTERITIGVGTYGSGVSSVCVGSLSGVASALEWILWLTNNRFTNQLVVNTNIGGNGFCAGIYSKSSATKTGSGTITNLGICAVGDGGDYNYGGYFVGSTGPIALAPSTSSSAPTHAAKLGTLWVTSAGVLYINKNGSTTWAKVGGQ